MMRTAFIRADASIAIGTGHIQRCLTLATALRESRWRCTFVCREFHGNLVAMIRQVGFEVLTLPNDTSLLHRPVDAWPQDALQQDAALCRMIMQDRQPNLVIVDHYALDLSWETAAIPSTARTLVISDLYGAQQAADILLNQNLGASADAYSGLLPDDCHLLMGTQYALLRPEFPAQRPNALKRRLVASPSKQRLLISLGGVDVANATGWVLREMLSQKLAQDWSVRVILGGAAPHRDDIAALVASMGSDALLDAGTTQMAYLMAEADVAIGAAGSTAWERCCLGLPTVMMVLAENQRAGAMALEASAAVKMVDIGDSTALAEALHSLTSFEERLMLSNAAAAVCDGGGTRRVSETINHLFRIGL
ncbi:MAG: UDP-2,4-diacetamido-2,4,6-trideoxy-beta-L-altropyranose hydrolase [Paracoccaceae bacterium]